MKNEELEMLIRSLKKAGIENGSKIWKRVAVDLEKPSRTRRTVCINSIDKNCKTGETAVIPGKVIGNGKTKIPIVTYSASSTVMKNNNVTLLKDYIKKNPKGSKCRILG